MPAFIAQKSKTETTKRAEELLDFLGLKNRLTHRPNELSGGEQQRVAVARALMNKPSVLLADEPSGNLDMQNKQELHNLFFKLRDELQQTIVIVTHDHELAAMSDRVLTMRDGLITNDTGIKD
jgi:lipoprotein-releasing system ATP-binding protein